MFGDVILKWVRVSQNYVVLELKWLLEGSDAQCMAKHSSLLAKPPQTR